jgi:hypothetical protein
MLKIVFFKLFVKCIKCQTKYTSVFELLLQFTATLVKETQTSGQKI